MHAIAFHLPGRHLVFLAKHSEEHDLRDWRLELIMEDGKPWIASKYCNSTGLQLMSLPPTKICDPRKSEGAEVVTVAPKPGF